RHRGASPAERSRIYRRPLVEQPSSAVRVGRDNAIVAALLRRTGDPGKGCARGDDEVDYRVDAVWRVLRRRLLGVALLAGHRSVYVRVLPPGARKVEDHHFRGKQL